MQTALEWQRLSAVEAQARHALSSKNTQHKWLSYMHLVTSRFKAGHLYTHTEQLWSSMQRHPLHLQLMDVVGHVFWAHKQQHISDHIKPLHTVELHYAWNNTTTTDSDCVVIHTRWLQTLTAGPPKDWTPSKNGWHWRKSIGQVGCAVTQGQP